MATIDKQEFLSALTRLGELAVAKRDILICFFSAAA